MTTKSQENIIHSAGSPKNEDRFTVVLSAHFLEWDTGTATDVRWAYDRLSPTGNGTCYQAVLRSNPGDKKEIVLPQGPISSHEILLGHKLPQLAHPDPLLEEQQKLNVIEIWDSEKVIALLQPNRMVFGQFKGPLYYVSTRATALLSVTAFPV